VNQTFLDIVENRRTFYELGKDPGLSREEIAALLHRAVKFAPSAFNSQSGRVALLLGGEHDKLWGITKETLQKIVPADSFSETEAKMDMFRSAYGTILFFEDQAVVKGLQEQFPDFQDHFPIWSLQSSGMLQFIVWTALEEAGMGANLQHYNPLIDERVKVEWNIPDSWKLLAQMPFGNILAPTADKTFLPIEDRVMVF